MEEYRGRRTALRKSLSDGVVVLFGNTEKDTAELRQPFVQEPNFLYLTGWTQPGAILIVTPTTDTLLLPRKDTRAEMWTGPKAAPSDQDIATRTGFSAVMPTEAFESELQKAAAQAPRILTLKTSPMTAKLAALLPLREMGDAQPVVARLRVIKSAAELAMIQKSVDVTLQGHRAAWKRMAPGLREYQLAATMTNLFQESGCIRHAYAPIVGSGINGTVLHYSDNMRRMDAGEVVVMDVAAECDAYAADITRTVPVNGKFTPRQREIYEIVLGAQNAVLAAMKPGMLMGGRNLPATVSLYQIAFDYINTHGKDRQGNPLGKYFTHGLGHHVGLDVHDPSETMAPLKANMVLTVEPGIYIPEEGIGVRIEDMVLVTETGAKLLSSSLPRDVADVEKALAK